MTFSSIRTALLGNASFSTLSGIILLSCSTSLNQHMHIHLPNLLPSIGLTLLLFAASLVWLSRRDQIPRREVLTVIGLDILWVIGSMVILLTPFAGLSYFGNQVVLEVAIVVGLFAIWQWRYLSQTV